MRLRSLLTNVPSSSLTVGACFVFERRTFSFRFCPYFNMIQSPILFSEQNSLTKFFLFKEREELFETHATFGALLGSLFLAVNGIHDDNDFSSMGWLFKNRKFGHMGGTRSF